MMTEYDKGVLQLPLIQNRIKGKCETKDIAQSTFTNFSGRAEVVKLWLFFFLGSVENQWGNKFFTAKYYSELCAMENDYLQMLAQIVLPSQILDYFTIAGVDQTATEIHIRLDEKMNPDLNDDAHFESKGFMDAVNVTDFPIRDHKVILRIRRRRWTDTRTGKSFSIPIDLDVVAKGTRYSKEFGAFLKETYGDVPDDLPYA